MKLVLFDVDGTLITSRGAGRRAMRLAFERTFGTAGGIDHYDLRGRTDTRIVHDVMAAAGWEAARIKERLDDFFEAYLGGLVAEIGDGQGVVTLPGVAASTGGGRYPFRASFWKLRNSRGGSSLDPRMVNAASPTKMFPRESTAIPWGAQNWPGPSPSSGSPKRASIVPLRS